MDTPYSTTMSRSMAAWVSPTSTPTPWATFGAGAAGDALAQRAEGPAGGGAHRVHAADLAAGHTGDLGHDALGDADLALVGGQGVLAGGFNRGAESDCRS